MIAFEDVIPQPLIEMGVNPQTQIWNQNLFFEKGKRYLIKAPSGKGKSTFLHLIYGLRKDYNGVLKWEDSSHSNLQEKDWSKIRSEHLSIVFQNLRLFPQLTALENIELNIFNKSTDIFDIKIMAEHLGVKELLTKPCHTLSYGQQQRIAIIRALAQNFDFLLLDEPFSHLDPENIKNAIHLINERCKSQQAGLILVSLDEDYGMFFDNTLLL